MRRSNEEKGVRARQRGKGHMTIIGLIMNTISPRTWGQQRAHSCVRVLVSVPDPHPVDMRRKWRTQEHQEQPDAHPEGGWLARGRRSTR